MKRSQIFWGIALLLIGSFLLALNFNLIPAIRLSMVPMFFLLGGLLFFTGYLTAGLTEWGLLFPATILSAIGAAIWISDTNLPSEYAGALIVGAVGIPFWVALATSRKNWWAIIPGGILTSVALLIFGTTLVQHDELVAGLFIAALGGVFLLVHVNRRDLWWALIPGGILLSLGLAIFTTGFSLPNFLQNRLFNLLFFFGMASTFGYLWLKRDDFPTAWGKYPSVALFVVGTFAVIIGGEGKLFFPVLAIAAGAWILIQERRGRRFWEIN